MALTQDPSVVLTPWQSLAGTDSKATEACVRISGTPPIHHLAPGTIAGPCPKTRLVLPSAQCHPSVGRFPPNPDRAPPAEIGCDRVSPHRPHGPPTGGPAAGNDRLARLQTGDRSGAPSRHRTRKERPHNPPVKNDLPRPTAGFA